MFKTENNFHLKFQNIAHQYPEHFSKHSFYEPNRKGEFPKFAISSSAPRFWNKVLPVSVKGLDTLLDTLLKYLILTKKISFSKKLTKLTYFRSI